MFLEKYVNNVYLDLIYSNYDIEYINMLDENNFKEIYFLFKKFKFNYINDIILNYLEIFDMDFDLVYKRLNKLKNNLGSNYVDIISNNMTYLDKILTEDA